MGNGVAEAIAAWPTLDKADRSRLRDDLMESLADPGADGARVASFLAERFADPAEGDLIRGYRHFQD